jgi:hypothetical protein
MLDQLFAYAHAQNKKQEDQVEEEKRIRARARTIFGCRMYMRSLYFKRVYTHIPCTSVTPIHVCTHLYRISISIKYCVSKKYQLLYNQLISVTSRTIPGGDGSKGVIVPLSANIFICGWYPCSTHDRLFEV